MIEALLKPATAISVHWVDDVLVVAVRGRYDRALHREMRWLAQGELLVKQARAVVDDFRQAEQVMTQAERVGVVDDAAADDWPIATPIAVVVQTEVLESGTAMCAAARARGWLWRSPP